MKAGAWDAIDRVLDEAADRPLDEGRALVRERLAGDDEATRQALRLLEARTRADAAGFLGGELDDGPASTPDERPIDGLEGRRTGPYRLRERIGDGGASAVYAAVREDGTFEREVAVKVVAQPLSAPFDATRFAQERQILARLEHPHIARLYDSGTTEDGLPYLVLEKVDGQPIDRAADQAELGVRSRIELVVKICGAVAHAHRALVVHRDLKPSNLLVGADGEPRLLDFGIAKLLETGSGGGPGTGAWLRVLTPGFASLEQVRGEPVTTASDVYSLGVILFLLLTGRMPLATEGLTLGELEVLLRERDAPLASATAYSASAENLPRLGLSPDSLARRLRGDLDAILAKALSADVGERYQTVDQLADDLRKHLDGHPVQARPIGLAARGFKFLRRHRAASLLAALALALAATLVIQGLLQARRLAAERDRAVIAQRQSDETVSLLEEVFSATLEGEDLTVREAMRQIAAALQYRLPDQPIVRAHVLESAGRVFLSLGALDEAESVLTQAIALRREHHGPGSIEFARAQAALGEVLGLQGNTGPGEEQIREAIDTLVELGAPPLELIGARNSLVSVLCLAEQFEEADEPSKAVLELARNVLPTDSARLAAAVANRGRVVGRLGDQEQALLLNREAADRFEVLYGPGHPERLVLMNNLAMNLHRLGRYEEAISTLDETIAQYRELQRTPSIDLARSLYTRSSMARAREDWAGTEANLRDSLEILEQSREATPFHVATIWISLADLLTETERASEAEDQLRQYRPGWRDSLGALLFTEVEEALGRSLLAQGRGQEAVALLEEGIARLQAIESEDPLERQERLDSLQNLLERAMGEVPRVPTS